MPAELTGTIVRTTEKGFHFVRVGEKDDYFLHHSEIVDFELLEKGDQVTFTPQTTDKGLRAVKAQRV